MPKSEIIKLQKILNENGANIKVDGIWGPKTEAAYNEFMSSGSSSAKNSSSSGNPTLDLQRQLNASGYQLKEDGIWGPNTERAYTDFLTSSVSKNKDIEGLMATNRPEDIISAVINNDWTSIVDEKGVPFSTEDYERALKQGEKDIEPYYREMEDYETQNVEDILKQRQLDYQNYLATSGSEFQTEKATQDKAAADTGVLFSGSRVQKLQNLKDKFEREQEYKRASAGLDIANTAREFQYKYGNEPAKKLSSYYQLGGNVYNPNVATGGVSKSGLSKIYSPGASDFYGTKPREKSVEAQKIASGLLWNKANKIMPSSYKNQYNS